MVPYGLEEYAAAKGRYLQRGDVDVGIESPPCVGTNAIGDQSRKQAIEVKEEEDGQNAAYEKLNQKHPARSLALES